MLDTGWVGVPVTLDAPKQLAKLAEISSDDEADVIPAGPLPFGVKTQEITEILRQERAIGSRGVGELGVIGDLLIGPTGLMAALSVIAAIPQRFGQSPENLLVGVNPNP